MRLMNRLVCLLVGHRYRSIRNTSVPVVYYNKRHNFGGRKYGYRKRTNRRRPRIRCRRCRAVIDMEDQA